MSDYKFIDKITSPADVKKLSGEELAVLCDEIRSVLIETVSDTGGHLASNLGTVELSVALHKMFNSPNDKIIWDVGHQAYTHKLLTGRYGRFSTLRTENGLSGFLRPDESEHDIFYTGHSSTSVSQATGVAVSQSLKNSRNYTVAVVGDGSFTGGMVYEALNNAGRTSNRLIVILNDNEMSISENVGSVARYLAVVRAKPEYSRFKARTEKIISHIPLIGKKLAAEIFVLKNKIKNMIYSRSLLFEDLGFKYVGPIDGHNIDHLCDAISTAKSISRPVLLHINTKKGKGYDFAENAPEKFHGISRFDVDSGEPVQGGETFSSRFGDTLCNFARNDKRICAITAAMSIGTGLEPFSKEFPSRFFDVGIAEEHAVTFASGLTADGMVPVFAVYSTFLQRCYDQLIHDGALQRRKMVVAVDRAGFVGEDGETHQGIFDVSMLNGLPNTTVYSPSTFDELSGAMFSAFYRDENVVVVRYPRGGELPLPSEYTYNGEPFCVYGDESADTAIVTYGRLFSFAAAAVDRLIAEGIKAKVIKLTRIKPIDDGAFAQAVGCKNLFFFEEGIKSGGVGEKFAAGLLEKGYGGKWKLVAVNDKFVEHAGVNSLLKKYNLDEDSMVETVRAALRKDVTADE